MSITEYDMPVIVINGMRFKDVTDITVSGRTYSYDEAVAKSQGKEIITMRGK